MPLSLGPVQNELVANGQARVFSQRRLVMVFAGYESLGGAYVTWYDVRKIHIDLVNEVMLVQAA